MRTRVVLGLVAVGLAASGCSGGEPDPAAADLEAAVRAYSDAFFANDAQAAHGMLSARCQADQDLEEFARYLDVATALYSPAPELRTVDVDVNGSAATATYTYSDATVNVTDQRWVLEDGSWRHDGC